MSIVLDGDKGVTQNTTEAARLPSGTTAERPANPVAGMIRFNTDEGYFEGYDPVADDWFKTRDLVKFVATGGTETTITDNGVTYKVHTFTSSDTFNVISGSNDVEYLVVAGGGGGSKSNYATGGGAGGAGGYRSSVTGEASGQNSLAESSITTFAGSYSVTVGAGGADRSNGSNSSVFNIVSVGGGHGAGYERGSASSGGSGGGGAYANQPGEDGTSGQGFSGGNSTIGGGGGGGGASEPGFNSPSDNEGGNGGAGLASSIDGLSTFRAGGGGGGTTDFYTSGPVAGSGGNGGGGDGSATSAGLPGVSNTGGGGGGPKGDSSLIGGNGGSGIVIIRYQI